MIYGYNSLLRDSDPVARLTPAPNPSETSVPTEVAEEGQNDYLREEGEEGEIRAVYEGDISDTILRKLSAYYNQHSGPFDRYVIYRSGQYTYHLVYGSSSNYTNWTSAYDMVYTVSSSYNQNSATFAESRHGSFSLGSSDLTGSTGYIYSSSSDFPASSYVDSNRATPLLLTMLLITLLGSAVYRWVHSMLFRSR